MFTRLFGGPAGSVERSVRAARSANLVAPMPGAPSYAVAVPRQVTAVFHAHESVDGVKGNFLTAVTEGLSSNGQRELVLSLRLGNREDPLAKMQQLLLFFATVYAWAAEGNLANEGGFTQFGERGLFQRAHSGLLYASARPIADLELPPRALAAIFVDAQEVRAALDYGTYRVLTRIALQLRLFPYPAWGALDRPSAMTPRESESTLTKVARVRAPGISFVVADQCLRLSIPSDTPHWTKGLNALPAGARFVLLTQPAPSANAILVWRPGQRETVGISPDGSDRSRVSGSCLMVTPGGTEDQASQFEDGYWLRFSSESWPRFSAALAEQQPFSLSLAKGMRLELEWLPPGPR